MQYTLHINQVKALEWGLNLQQAAMFSFIYSAATWAAKDGEFWNVSKGKIIEELPILTNKPDTIYRLRKGLKEKGLIECKLINGKDFYRVTDAGLEWNSSASPASEKNPSNGKESAISPEKNPVSTGKISDVSIYQDQDTNDHMANASGRAVPACPHQKIIDLYHDTLPANPRIVQWTDTRKSYLQSRWREDPDRQTLDWWQQYFSFVSRSDFLCGRIEPTTPGRKPFKADLEWLVRPSNFVKVLEGKYA